MILTAGDGSKPRFAMKVMESKKLRIFYIGNFLALQSTCIDMFRVFICSA